jgi:gliding motility-associated-like protein
VFTLGADRYECAGDTVILSAALPSSTYLWNNGTTNDSLRVTGTGLYWLNVYNGCTYRDSVYLTFTPYPVVDLGRDTVNCYGQPILLQSAGAFSTPFYLWSTGATTDTTTVTATDQYWLRVTVLGCSTTDSINVTIHHDTFTLYNRDTAICMGKQVQVFLTANPAATFQWLPTTGIAFSTTGTPLITPDTSTMYKVQISLADCPLLEDSFQIDVQPNPIVYAGGNRTICQYDTLRLYANVNPNWYTGYWYNWSPNINIDNFAVQDPVFTAGTTQKYVVTVSTSAGCVGKDSLVVNVNPGDFAAMGSDVSVCPGDSVQLSATGGVAYQWIPSMYLGDSTSGTPWIKAITNQRYTVIVTSAAGCRDTVEVNVRVFPGATFYQLDSFFLYPGETVQLSPQTNCTSVTWFPPQGLDNPFISNPIASPGTSSRYIVTGVTENGCIGKDTVYVNVMAESVVKTPNAFTPGKGTNNEYRINLRGEARLNYFRIYNRWGNLVFETKDISEGWDGNYKGTPQPFGVYVYVIQAVTGTGQLVTKQGNLTLLR